MGWYWNITWPYTYGYTVSMGLGMSMNAIHNSTDTACSTLPLKWPEMLQETIKDPSLASVIFNLTNIS